jgi:hypothetical protein
MNAIQWWAIALGVFFCLGNAPTPLPFLVLDTDGNEAGAKVPGTPVMPFGVLVGGDPSGAGMSCTATHLNPGLGITAAHCFRHPNNWKYAILFYGPDGRRYAYPVTQVTFMGDTTIDVATFVVPPEAVAVWGYAGFNIRHYRTTAPPPGNHSEDEVTLWTYTPLKAVPELARRFGGRDGMIFRANHCLASQLHPQIELRQVDPVSHKERAVHTENILDAYDSARHLFFDHCKFPTVPGNSGSLVTLENDFTQKIGILFVKGLDKEALWKKVETSGLQRQGIKVYYRGIDTRDRELSWVGGDFSISGAALLQVLWPGQ